MDEIINEINDLDEALLPEETESQEDFILATVAEVTASGVKIAVDGAGEAGTKEYKANTIQKFAEGDRVKICKNSGSYLVEYKIGNPMADYPIPSGGADGQVLTKDGLTDYSVKWSDPGGSSNKLVSGSYSVELSSSGVLASSSSVLSIDLGSSSNRFHNLYTNGSCYICGSTATNVLSFFGQTGARRQTVANNATVATLITALKAYGLIS